MRIDVKTTLNNVTKVATLGVSQKFGHLFLQTDKPLYHPKEKLVHIRFMATDADLKPVDRRYRLQVEVSETRAPSTVKNCRRRREMNSQT